MTWGRGFFRLWLVLAALWVAGAIAFIGPGTYRWWPNKLIKLNVGGQEVQVDETLTLLRRHQRRMRL
jgi:hypothetical protein